MRCSVDGKSKENGIHSPPRRKFVPLSHCSLNSVMRVIVFVVLSIMSKSTFQAGFGAQDYTPVPVDDAYTVFDPISFRALILQDQDVNVTFLSGDVFSIESDLLDRVKDRLSDIPWLDLDHLLPCASHIGTAPILFPSYVNQPCEALRFYGREDYFADHMAAAVRKAAESMTPARIGLGKGTAPGILYNRRSYDDQGKLVMSNFKFPYPRPELQYGPVDDQVYVLRIDDVEGRPVQVGCVFGCHALCSTDKYGHISADYPGALRAVLESAGMNALFMPGAIGNVVPVSRAGRTYQRVGRSAGGVALYAMEQITTTDTPDLTVNQEVLSLPVYPHPEPVEAEAVLADTPASGDGMQRFQMYGSRRRADGRNSLPYTITRIAVQGAQLIHLPGEVFVETARAIQDAAGNRLTVVLSGPSADIGYLSPPDAHSEGGMEPQFAGLAVEAETSIRSAACAMVEPSA